MRRFWRFVLFAEDDARWQELLSEWVWCVIDFHSDFDVFTSLNNKYVSRRSVVPVNILACLRRCIKVTCSTVGIWEIALPTAALAPCNVSLLQICNNITETLELAVRKYFECRFLLLKRMVICMFTTHVVFWNNAKFQHTFSRLFLKFTNIFHATPLYSLQDQVIRTNQVLLASYFKTNNRLIRLVFYVATCGLLSHLTYWTKNVVSFLPLVITDPPSFQISTDTYNMLFVREFYSPYTWTVKTSQSLQLRILTHSLP